MNFVCSREATFGPRLTKVLYDNVGPAVSHADYSDHDKNGNPGNADAMLPDTGGADVRLLGYGALMIAGGGWLTARGRRRRHV